MNAQLIGLGLVFVNAASMVEVQDKKGGERRLRHVYDAWRSQIADCGAACRKPVT
jgi:hypothetical protein